MISYKAVLFDLDGTLVDTIDDLADSMNSIQLIVVDDWTPRTGHVSPMTLASVEALAGSNFANRGGILLVSAAYSDASGEHERDLKARGERRLGEFGFTTWWLQNDGVGVGHRSLTVGEEKISVRLDSNGFV